MSVELKDTLNLPKTAFSMRANLVEREPQRIAHWQKSKLYERIQKKYSGKKKFVLHDGPPFTNGDVHIGTALNKILKDTILKYKSMQGMSAPFVPGWDCHGLPIEHKVTLELRKNKETLSSAELRQRCEQFSRDYSKKQKAQFERLGILADWDHEYRTMDPQYEAEIIRTFAKFVDQELVYRSKKPVYWSIPCATALAEAEIEYKDHTSPSIYVKFPLQSKEHPFANEGVRDIYAVIWTTTPWTLPSNLAVAVHPELDYQVVINGDEGYIVAAKLAETFIKECELKNTRLTKTVKGSTLENIKTGHPFIDRESPFVLADYVTTDAGTGCVHTAPGHGPDDYLTALKYGIEIYCPLDDHGRYIEDGRVPQELVKLSVLHKPNGNAANDAVIKILKEKESLVHLGSIRHSYPHCWRSKTPVIFRAVDQWFVALDKNNTRKKALQAIKEVKWTPHWGENRIAGAVESRPDWCISRQRSWGVPIIAFFDTEGNALLDGNVIRAIADKIEKHGTNLWFEKSAQELLEGIKLPKNFEGKEISKGPDTLDVWIDSGCSHKGVLEKNQDLKKPADLYFEGSDQHRGWFQSSLWTGVVADGRAPYEQVITHGFVVNENMEKISKSDKKPQTADSYVNDYGTDILRLWINSEDYRTDVPISEGILKQIVQTYRSIRNTLRFQLGNLYDFELLKHEVPVEKMTTLDQWAMHHTAILIEQVTQANENYEFHKAYQSLNRFCTVTLSAIYHDILKDRLYTYAPNSFERRSSQTAIYHIFNTFVRLLAPILAFTTEEAYELLHGEDEFTEKSIHLEAWPKVESSWNNKEAFEEVEVLLAVRNFVNEKLEAARQKKELGQSLDAQVSIALGKESPYYSTLQKHQALLPEFFIVSQVTLQTAPQDDIQVVVKPAEGVRCPRSWRWVSKLVSTGEFGEVSERCHQALLEKYPNIKLTLP